MRFALPTGIEVGGVFYELETDFRVWIEFLRSVEDEGLAPVSIFKAEVPDGDWLDAALEFARSENVTPRGSGDGERSFDFIYDGDYLVGAFQQAYGIDLTTARMHWHRFLALFRSLPSGCKMVEIIGYRTYRPDKRKPEQVYGALRKAWTLPPKRDAAILEWQEQMFGNVRFPE